MICQWWLGKAWCGRNSWNTSKWMERTVNRRMPYLTISMTKWRKRGKLSWRLLCLTSWINIMPKDLQEVSHGICKVGGSVYLMPIVTRRPDVGTFNYCMQICHWFLYLVQMDDTAKEGDLHRTVLNCQYSLPFFYSLSNLSKYMVENINNIVQCKYLSSPLQRIRILEGSYINCRGGVGRNVKATWSRSIAFAIKHSS